MVTAPPTGSTYQWISTDQGTHHEGLPNIGGNNGSLYRTSMFSAAAGESLEFYFNYVTSDGQQYADYTWARLLHPDLSEAAMLFNARTKPAGNIVPGQDLPSVMATLNPASVEIKSGTTWAPLGSSSGACYGLGCGFTDWVFSQFTIGSAGNYILEFGVMNYLDESFDSGLAWAGAQVGGAPIDPTVALEPVSMALLGTGLAGIGAVRRRRKREASA